MLRRRAELARIVAAELRGTLISDIEGHFGHQPRTSAQQAAGLEQLQTLSILKL